MRSSVRFGDVARELRTGKTRPACVREKQRTRAGRLSKHRVVVDALLVDPRWRAGFQPHRGKAKPAQSGGQADGRGFAEAALGANHFPSKGLPPKKSAGRKDYRFATERPPIGASDPANRAGPHDQIFDQTTHDRKIWLRGKQRERDAGVCRLVHLLAQRAHRRTFAFVQKTRVEAAAIGDAGHRPAEGVDLSDELPFCATADGRIARQRANFFGFPRNEQRGNAESR